MTRLLETINMIECNNEATIAAAKRNLRILMFGYHVLQVEKYVGSDEFLTELDHHIEETLKGPVQQLITNWYGLNLSVIFNDFGKWKGFDEIKMLEVKDKVLLHHVGFGKEVLTYMSHCNKDQLIAFSKAIYKKEARARHYKQHVITSGDVIELFLEENQQDHQVLHPSEDGEGTSYVFVAHALVGRHESDVWAVCSRLQAISDGTEGLYRTVSTNANRLQVIKLNEFVRRAHVIPSYDYNCMPSKSCLCDGAAAFVLRRKDGYPQGKPRVQLSLLQSSVLMLI